MSSCYRTQDRLLHVWQEVLARLPPRGKIDHDLQQTRLTSGALPERKTEGVKGYNRICASSPPKRPLHTCSHTHVLEKRKNVPTEKVHGVEVEHEHESARASLRQGITRSPDCGCYLAVPLPLLTEKLQTLHCGYSPTPKGRCLLAIVSKADQKVDECIFITMRHRCHTGKA